MRWRIRLGQFLSSSPAVADGVVYIGSVTPSTLSGGALHAVDADTGEERWRAVTGDGDGFLSSPAVVDDSVYIGSYDGIVLAVSTSGIERWRATVDGPVSSSPAVAAGLVYVSDDSGRLWALDAETGRPRWSFAPGRPFDRGMTASPAVVAETVFQLSTARRVGERAFVHALDAHSGGELWRFEAPEGGQLTGTPAVAGGRVYAITTEGVVYAIDAGTGLEAWRRAVGAPAAATTVAVAVGLVHVVTSDGAVGVLDAETGEVLARRSVEGRTPVHEPADGGWRRALRRRC